jgi:hypothetical protein
MLRGAMPALLGGFAGCQTVAPTASPTRTPWDTPPSSTPRPATRTATGSGPHPPGTLVDVDGAIVGVRSLSVRVAAVCPGAWMTRLASRDGFQYLVAAVSPYDDGDDGDPGPYDRFALSLDGRRYEAGLDGSHPPDKGLLLFELPADLAPSRGRLEWTGPRGTTVSWRLPTARLRELRLSPSFSLGRFEARSVERTGDHEVHVELLVRARNDGERAGQFVGVVHLPTNDRVADLNPSAVVSAPLPVDDAATWHRRVRWPFPDPDGAPRLAWARGSARAAVSVPD